MAACKGLHRSRTARLNTFAYLALLAVQSVAGLAQIASSPKPAESEEVHRLNDEVSAQADKLAAQSKQIEEQQADIKALQSAFAEQKALLEKLLRANPTTPGELAAVTPANQPAEAAANQPAVAQTPPPETVQSAALKEEEKEQPFIKEPTHWYDKISARGYMQMRDNNLVNTNSLYTCDQCDKSIGPNNTFFLRRMRLVLSGNISDHVAFYFQPDFASASGTSQNYAQIRDAYFDVSIDKEKEHRI